jgi:hypothetical protein
MTAAEARRSRQIGISAGCRVVAGLGIRDERSTLRPSLLPIFTDSGVGTDR